MPMTPTRRHKRSTNEKVPAHTFAGYYRMRLTTPNNTTPPSHEDYLDYLRSSE
jgi:hypothetical protein